MLARNVLLIIGVLALLSGVGLSVAWMRQSQIANTQPAPAAVVTQAVLVASRQIPAGTLLRPGDMTWENLQPLEVVSTSLVRGRIVEADLVGSAARRAFRPQEQLVLSALANPTERDFLVVALAPGYRAVSVGVDAAQSTSGLVLPGDRVDVILTQSFPATATNLQSKTVGETVLHDLRVIATDQTFNAAARPGEPPLRTGASDFRIPKTVTLEVTEQQAQVLLVADQLGKIQLALRGKPPVAATLTTETPVLPTWAADVSPALKKLANDGPAAKQGSGPAAKQGSAGAIEVMRGAKVERRCSGADGLVACQ